MLWLRRNFFNSPFSIIMIVLSLYLLWSVVPSLFGRALWGANWSGSDRSVCDANPDGACWTALRVRLWQVMMGLYYGANTDQIWRPLVVFAAFCVIIVALLAEFLPSRRRVQLAFLSRGPANGAALC